MTAANHTFVVSDAFMISGRGLGVFFEGDPPVFPRMGMTTAKVTTPDGRIFENPASIEAARKIPPGEVMALLLYGLSRSDVPIGSEVVLPGSEWS